MAKKKSSSRFDRTILLLQGGGALGAYQVGVFKGLAEQNLTPNWLVATSIGAINSAIIAGNSPKKRVKKLLAFWEAISTKLPTPPDSLNNILYERYINFLSAFYALTFGQPGFFKPRAYNPWFGLESSTDKLSFYDTDDLRTTLLKFVDFDLINEKKIRLSISAVHVKTGLLVYFDNTKLEIKPEHVMACCAFPPGFPAVQIGGEMFWDGGVNSNTQINLLFSDDRPIRSLCFMVHLFDSYGIRPINMDDILKRQKDINYASHHREFIMTYREIHNLRHAIRELGEQLSKEQKKNSELKKLLNLGRSGIIHLVRFHCKANLSDLSSKDFDFGWPSITNRIHCGYEDVCRTFKNQPWNKPVSKKEALIVHEISQNASLSTEVTKLFAG